MKRLVILLVLAVCGQMSRAQVTANQGFSTTPWFEISTLNNGFIRFGGNDIYSQKISTTREKFQMNKPLVLKLNETVDWSYGLTIQSNRDKTKALVITHATSGEVFTVWGSGAINAKKLWAEEVQVTPNVVAKWWPDYVFTPDYKLRPLNEVEQYINNNGHLPEVPSEAMVEENGINLAEMHATLLKKVEELTLYAIQQQKEIEGLKKQVQQTK